MTIDIILCLASKEVHLHRHIMVFFSPAALSHHMYAINHKQWNKHIFVGINL